MRELLNRPFLLALATVITGVLTHYGVVPADQANYYAGEAVTGVLAALTSRAAFVAWASAKAAEVATKIGGTN